MNDNTNNYIYQLSKGESIMAKTKTERILSIEEQIAQLANRKKQLIQKQKEDDRKVRTKRLIERGAIVESLISDADMLTNEQVQTFLARTIQTEYAKKILNGLKVQSSEATAHNPTEATLPKATATEPKDSDTVAQAS